MATNIKIKIDTGTIPVLVKNKKILKLYSFYLILKTLDVKKSGFIDYKTDLIRFCKIMNISQRTFYNRLNACIYHEVLIRSGTGVKLASFGKVADIFQLQPSREFIEIDSYDNRLEDQLRAEAIRLNIISQTKEVHRKINEIYDTKDHHPEQIRLTFLTALIATFITGASMAFPLSVAINPDVTLSTYGTAKLFGLTAHSSGHYWQQSLVKKSLLEMENRLITSGCFCDETRIQGKIFFSPQEKKKCLQLRNLLKPL